MAETVQELETKELEMRLKMAGETRSKLNLSVEMNRDNLARLANEAYRHGMSYQEIADKLGVAKRTVWLWLNSQS